jgi:cytochrome P450
VQTLGWILRTGPYLERLRRRYGDVFTFQIGQEPPWVMLADPDHIREVFTGDPNVLRAGEANQVLRPVVGSRSVLLLDEPEHLRERRLMLPPFHGERMQRYGEIVDDAARVAIERWPAGAPFALWPWMQEVTLEVIMRAVFGYETGTHMERMRGLLGTMLEWSTRPRALAILATRGPSGLERHRGFRRAIDPVHEELVAQIRRIRDAPDLDEREDIVSMLLRARFEDGSALSDVDLRDELITLLVAGHETTATSLSWALERLVRHPAVLARLREEEGDAYLDAVIQETLRLRPVIPIVVRRLAAPYRIAGYDLPAGVAVVPNVYLVHRREDVYPQPAAFRPERFLERPPGTYTWIPFGGGVRRCLGASFAQFEMKGVLRAIVERTDLRAPAPASERTVRRAITLVPRGRAEVVLERRRVPAALIA